MSACTSRPMRRNRYTRSKRRSPERATLEIENSSIVGLILLAENTILPASRWPSRVTSSTESGVTEPTTTGPSHGPGSSTTRESPRSIGASLSCRNTAYSVGLNWLGSRRNARISSVASSFGSAMVIAYRRPSRGPTPSDGAWMSSPGAGAAEGDGRNRLPGSDRWRSVHQRPSAARFTRETTGARRRTLTPAVPRLRRPAAGARCGRR